MPSNHNHVCVECRYAARHPGRCPQGHGLFDIGYKLRVPKKRDNKGWLFLQNLLEFRHSGYLWSYPNDE